MAKHLLLIVGEKKFNVDSRGHAHMSALDI